MSMPRFPATPDLKVEDSIVQIISSIAMEELALSHILNAEGEKLQYVLGTLEGSCHHTPPTFEQLLEVNESVREMLSAASMNQMFLMGKMATAMSAYSALKSSDNGNPNPPVTNGETPNDGSSQGAPAAVKVAEIDGELLGDPESPWLKIAVAGDYSLLVRKNFLNIRDDKANQGKPAFQYMAYGTKNDYEGSNVQAAINKWFAGTAPENADNLDDNALLRRYTVKNTAMVELGKGPGSGNAPVGFDNGFSKPLNENDSKGKDTAFALSYGEAANYISKRYSYGSGASIDSPDIARRNFDKISIPSGSMNYNSAWLRSPGNKDDKACVLYYDGRVFQNHIADSAVGGLAYPAVWVRSKIFEELEELEKENEGE